MVNGREQTCLAPLKALDFLVTPRSSSSTAMDSLDPQVRDFILFCIERRGNTWPTLYDEMAMVAGQRLFRGLGHDELKQLGLSLALDHLDDTIQLVKQAVAQDQQL